MNSNLLVYRIDKTGNPVILARPVNDDAMAAFVRSYNEAVRRYTPDTIYGMDATGNVHTLAMGVDWDMIMAGYEAIAPYLTEIQDADLWAGYQEWSSSLPNFYPQPHEVYLPGDTAPTTIYRN